MKDKVGMMEVEPGTKLGVAMDSKTQSIYIVIEREEGVPVAIMMTPDESMDFLMRTAVLIRDKMDSGENDSEAAEDLN